MTPATQPLSVIPYYQATTEFLGGQVESCSQYHGQLVENVRLHPLMETVHRAFATHRPISLSPDIIWLTLTQGLAHHINANSEQLRRHFAGHNGKEQIRVRRDDFIKGSPENPWSEVFSEFSAAIRASIGEAHGLIVADFSTTGPVERAASEIVLMDSMQAYFSYVLETKCGIPSITLEGTPDDWKAIARRVQEFRRFGLDWWVAALEPILHQFSAAAGGEIDQRFWESIYKWNGHKGSGKGPFVTGWILKLFPYLSPVRDGFLRRTESASTFCRNPWMSGRSSEDDGPGPGRFPRLPARAPFLWKVVDTEYRMELIGGLLGIRQDPQTLCLRPEIGWAVWEVGAEERKRTSGARAVPRAREAKVWSREELEAARKRQIAAEKEDAARNAEPNQRFAEARALGLRIHEFHVAAGSDETLQPQVLLDLALKAYETDPEFRELWELVHGGSPAPSHATWLSLWKRV